MDRLKCPDCEAYVRGSQCDICGWRRPQASVKGTPAPPPRQPTQAEQARLKSLIHDLAQHFTPPEERDATAQVKAHVEDMVRRGLSPERAFEIAKGIDKDPNHRPCRICEAVDGRQAGG